MDLSNLSLAELKSLSDQVKKDIAAREQEEVKKAREQILAIAHSVGVPLTDLLGGKVGKEGKISKPVEVKFRHPSDASKTWTGRGRQPGWVAELEKAGQLNSARV